MEILLYKKMGKLKNYMYRVWGKNKGGWVITSRLFKGEVVTTSAFGLLKGEFSGQF